VKRSLIALLLTLALVGCAHRVPPRAPLFPLSPIWEQNLDDFVVPPLGADARRLFVATRAGTIYALSQETGAVLWKRQGQPGRLAAAPGRLIVHAGDGTVTSLRVRNGEVRWTTQTPVVGDAPPAPTLEGERVYVAGRGPPFAASIGPRACPSGHTRPRALFEHRCSSTKSGGASTWARPIVGSWR